MLNEIWKSERYPTIPSAHPELQKAAMNIYIDEQADTGILLDEQDWLTLKSKATALIITHILFF